MSLRVVHVLCAGRRPVASAGVPQAQAGNDTRCVAATTLGCHVGLSEVLVTLPLTKHTRTVCPWLALRFLLGRVCHGRVFAATDTSTLQTWCGVDMLLSSGRSS